MNRIGLILLALAIPLLTSGRLMADRELRFYTQSAALSFRQVQALQKEVPATRRIIPLSGRFAVLDAETGRSLGRVAVPFAFHFRRHLLFRKTFERQPPGNDHYFLRFGALNGRVRVRLNHKLFFEGSRNFLPIDLSVPGFLLQDSTNLLEVDIRPYDNFTGQFPLWTPVNLPRVESGILAVPYLEVAPPTFISHLTLNALPLPDSTLIRGEIALISKYPFAGQYRVELELRETSGRRRRRAYPFVGDSSKNLIKLPFQWQTGSLALWSPQTPRTPRLRIRLFRGEQLVDEAVETLVMRQPGTEGAAFTLNGAPLPLNGINYIYQDAKGVALTEPALQRQDLLKIKARKFNVLRLGFYPRSEQFYHLADSLGLLCFQDMPFNFLSANAIADSVKRQEVLDYVTEFLKIARRHPAIVGIGIPCVDPDCFRGVPDFRAALEEKIRQANCLPYLISPLPATLQARPDYPLVFEVLDRNNLEKTLPPLLSGLPPDMPVIFSGMCKAISYRVDSTRITHDLMQAAELYLRLNKRENRHKLAGQFALTFSNYYLETPSLQAGPQNQFDLNTNGIFDLQRQLKPAARKLFQIKRADLMTFAAEYEKKSIGTVIFILLGLINFLVFLVVYHSLYEFRYNLVRSIRKPHGFFTDLRERIIISYGESFFLILISAINAAVILGAILYFFRNNFYMDYLLSLLLPVPGLKLLVSQLVWKPILMVPLLAVIIAAVFVLFALPIRLAGFFVEGRISTRQALAVSAWSAAPFLILLSVSMFFYNLLILLKSYWILFAILLYFHVWYFFRWINGTRVMTGIPYARVFLFAVLALGVLFGGALFYYQSRLDIGSHLRFLVELYRELS